LAQGVRMAARRARAQVQVAAAMQRR